jgi:hypothetical protein
MCGVHIYSTGCGRFFQRARIRPGRTREDIPHHSHVFDICKWLGLLQCARIRPGQKGVDSPRRAPCMCAHSTGCRRFNARASVQDGHQWIFRASDMYLCSPQYSTVGVASMRTRVCPYEQRVLCTLTVTYSTGCCRFNARVSVQDGNEWIFLTGIIPHRYQVCGQSTHIPLIIVAQMRAPPSRTDNVCSAPSQGHIPLVMVASMRGRPSRMETSEYFARASCICSPQYSTGWGRLNAPVSVQDGE